MSWVDRLKWVRNYFESKQGGKSVVFHHVPKCGGTSVGRAIRRRYLWTQQTLDAEATYRVVRDLYGDPGPAESWQLANRFREEMLLYLMHSGVKCITAHIPFSLRTYECFKHQYAFVTVMREPVTRFISHYYYSYRRLTGLSLGDFLETDEAKYNGVRYSEYYQGLGASEDIYAESAVSRAKRNLHAFDVIGFIESPKTLEANLSKVLGVKVRLGHDNQRQVREKLDAPTPHELSRVREICRRDIEIYDYAVRTFKGSRH